MALTCGLKLHFGVGYPKENLPEGWALNQASKEFAWATAPDGKEYFLSEDKAYPRRQWGPDGYSPGEHYIDTENGVIELTPKK
jgi:hypothetical protein